MAPEAAALPAPSFLLPKIGPGSTASANSASAGGPPRSEVTTQALADQLRGERESVLQALSLYVNDSDISTLLAGRSPSATPRRINVTIQRRSDLAQHFTTSAAITASVGANIAGILSNSKEDYDARYRTGFSFSDLTANIAGVALGNALGEVVGEALGAALGDACGEMVGHMLGSRLG